MAKSATLICSTRAIKYADFSKWYDVIGTDISPKAYQLNIRMHPTLNHLLAIRLTNSKQSSPLPVLETSRQLTSSDPRDSILGMLGLLDNFKSLLPLPDYNKTTTQVFTDVAKRHLKQTKSLTFLEHASAAGTTQFFGHPSWVPYSSEHPAISAWRCKYKRACRDSKAIFDISSDDQELRLQGQEFDNVWTLPNELDQDALISGKTRRGHKFEHWMSACSVGFSLTSYPTGEPLKEVLWRTFCWNMDSYGGPLPTKTEDIFDEWYHILTNTSTADEYREQMRLKQNSFETYIPTNSQLCITAKGYLTSVPYTAKVGDSIVLLAGGKVPFILRPTGDHYHFVGPCYVHGIMNGEAFPEDLDELGWFSIR